MCKLQEGKNVFFDKNLDQKKEPSKETLQKQKAKKIFRSKGTLFRSKEAGAKHPSKKAGAKHPSKDLLASGARGAKRK